MRGRDRLLRFRQHQVQPLGVFARGLDADVGRLHHTAAAALGPAFHIGPEIVERQIPLVIPPVEPFGRPPPVPLPPAHIPFPAPSPRRCNRIQNFHNAHRLSPATGAGSHSPCPQPVTGKPALLSLLGSQWRIRAKRQCPRPAGGHRFWLYWTSPKTRTTSRLAWCAA